jgi:hypothetical protein
MQQLFPGTEPTLAFDDRTYYVGTKAEEATVTNRWIADPNVPRSQVEGHQTSLYSVCGKYNEYTELARK